MDHVADTNAPIPEEFSISMETKGGGVRHVTGTCVSCGTADIELNEQGECADCAGGQEKDEEEDE